MMDYYNGDMRGIERMPEYTDLSNEAPEIAAQQYLQMMNAQSPYASNGMMQPNMKTESSAISAAQNTRPNMQYDPSASAGAGDEVRAFMEQGYLLGADCFGPGAQRYAQQLMEFINDEFRDYLYYTALSRRAIPPSASRVFRSIAADELKHSRRFASAYFLITGKRYVPSRNTVEAVVVPQSYSQALRERYIAEARDAIKYRQFATGVPDRCLKRMAIDTSDDEATHARDILGIIQNM